MTEINQPAPLLAQTIRAWAGETIFKRGQDYQLRGRVGELAATSSGGLVAWVQGTSRYSTNVMLAPAGLSSRCTCPYGGTCKHAVAVALAYANRPAKAAPLPIAAPNDPRLVLLDRRAAAAEMLASTPATPAGPPGDPALHDFLSALPQPALVALLLEMAQRFPDLRDALAVRRMLANDDADELEEEVFGRILEAGVESGWGDDWDNERHLPDYDPVYDGLKLLLDRGHADAVVRLGEELLESGISQVEQTHDDGETSSAVAACLSLVFKALPHSSLAPHEQLRWAIDALLRDSYDLCDGAQAVLAQPYPPEAWSIVADDLLKRLNDAPAAAARDFSRDYQRSRLADIAITALEGAGRDEEIIPLCEREAVQSGSYERLVERLLATERYADAERWARTGIAATERQYPGIASSLRTVICTLRAQSGDWGMVAALRAGEFFDRPTMQAFRVLEEAAGQAQAQPAVRAAALHYLETGALPQPKERVVGEHTIPAWPLPDSGLPQPERHYPPQFPQLGLLIELAASEGRPNDVLRWYDQRSAGRAFGINDDMVADAVVQSHPTRAAAIWQQLAEARIAQTNPTSYQEAAVFLRKLRRVWTGRGKAADWSRYVAELRAANRRKRRLIETLDALIQEKE
jgi:uncharacterized Zn finger protein